MSDFSQIQSTESANFKKLEALLFAAPGLSSIEQLAKSIGISNAETMRLLDVLKTDYDAFHGIRLQSINGQYQLTTAPEFGEIVEQFLGLEVTSRLSQQALEVLAIIAYKQPTTRPEIDGIRGVNSDTVVKSLLLKGLIEELGRSEAPGRPFLYGVTSDFLLHFGLESLDQLPAIDFDQLTGKSNNQDNEQRILKD